MLKLYYTVISEKDKLNDRPDLSLGGYKSGTPVPNAMFNNLFGDVSCYSVYNDQEEYIGLVLKNEAETDLTGVKMWFVYPENSQKKLEVAAVEMNSSEQMEIIGNPFSRPLYAEFFEADGEENAVVIGDMPAGGELGVWFKKIINISPIIEQESDIKLFNDGNPEKGVEDIEIIFEWD